MTERRDMPPSPAPSGFSPLTEACADLGESPVWRAEDATLWWVDVEGCALLRTDAAGGTQAWPTPEPAGFVQLDDTGAPLVGMETGIFSFDEAAGTFALLAPLDEPGRRSNDACVDAAGRLWFGTMDKENLRPNGTLHVMGPDAVPRVVISGFRTINGLVWDTGRERLFVSDSHAAVQTLWTLRPTDASPALEVFARFDAFDGRPDGAVMDAEGCVWIAGVGGAELLRFAPDATLLSRHPTPMAQPTKPAFYGEGLTHMALASRRGDNGGGRLHAWASAAETGVLGAPAPRWRRGAERNAQAAQTTDRETME